MISVTKKTVETTGEERNGRLAWYKTVTTIKIIGITVYKREDYNP